MVTRKAVIFLMALLLGFCDESFGASGWTEVRNPDTYTNRALAEFAYAEKKRYRSGGLTFLVTQARHKYHQGTEYHLGFIVYQNGVTNADCPALHGIYLSVESAEPLNRG
uniref:Cystatin n=1 Tax=Rhipicephalus zambeziensis TaxID=60191 RepID=A0A224YDA8_9ACAR